MTEATITQTPGTTVLPARICADTDTVIEGESAFGFFRIEDESGANRLADLLPRQRADLEAAIVRVLDEKAEKFARRRKSHPGEFAAARVDTTSATSPDWAALARAEAGECIEVDAPCDKPAEPDHIYCAPHGRRHVREYGTPSPTVAEFRAELVEIDGILGATR